jgi:hypothetical protein
MFGPPEEFTTDDYGIVRREEVLLYSRSAANGWPVTDELRKKVLEMAEKLICDENVSSLRKIAAGRLIINADAVNARREATEVQRRAGEVARSTAALRAALSDPAVRAALAAATESLCVQSDSGVQGDPPVMLPEG